MRSNSVLERGEKVKRVRFRWEWLGQSVDSMDEEDWRICASDFDGEDVDGDDSRRERLPW